MADITRWDPFNDMRALLDWPRRPFFEFARPAEAFGALAVDVFEENGDLVVKAEIPGIQKEDLQIHVTDGVLQISAETKADREIDEKDYYLHEVRTGKMSRSLRLPPDVDGSRAKAAYDNGVVRIRMPKRKEAAAHSTKVPVA